MALANVESGNLAKVFTQLSAIRKRARIFACVQRAHANLGYVAYCCRCLSALLVSIYVIEQTSSTAKLIGGFQLSEFAWLLFLRFRLLFTYPLL